MQTFEQDHFYKFIFSCGLYVKIFMWSNIQVSTKTITWILYDPSYFDKIINMLLILQGMFKLLILTVYYTVNILI